MPGIGVLPTTLSVPWHCEVSEWMGNMPRKKRREATASELAAATERLNQARQEAVNFKCAALGVERVGMARNEHTVIAHLVAEFDPVTVADWYVTAARVCEHDYDQVKYVCGIARRVRGEQLPVTNRIPSFSRN